MKLSSKKKRLKHDETKEVEDSSGKGLNFSISLINQSGFDNISPMKASTKKPRRSSLASKENLRSSSHIDLFDSIFDENSNLKELCMDWFKKYRTDDTRALMELLKMILRCSGFTKEIDPSMIESCEFEQISPDSSGFPLSPSEATGRKYKTRLRSFFENFIHIRRNDLTDYQTLLDMMLNWLLSLSISSVRSYRYVSTLIAMRLMLLMAKLSLTAEEDQRKKGLTTSSRTSQSMTEETIEFVEEAFKRIFDSVFIHRYRDVWHEIREICITELGEIMITCPSKFMTHEYQKYTGWLLYDRSPNVRLAALNSLHKMLTDDRNVDLHINLLKLFLKRFKERLISMCYDINEKVALICISVCQQLLLHSQFTQKDVDVIHQLVFDHRKATSIAAAQFVATKIRNIGSKSHPDAILEPKKNSKFDIILAFVCVINEIFDHSKLRQLIQSIYRFIPEVNDLTACLELLNSNSDDLGKELENGILRLISSVGEEIYHRYEFLKSQEEAKLSIKYQGELIKRKQLNNLIKQHERMYISIIEKLDDLLTTYGNDDDDLISLIHFFNFFPLKLIDEQLLKNIIQQTEAIFQRTYNSTLMDEICKFWCNIYENIDNLSVSELHDAILSRSVLNVDKEIVSLQSKYDAAVLLALSDENQQKSVNDSTSTHLTAPVKFQSLISKLATLIRYHNIVKSIKINNTVYILVQHIVENDAPFSEIVENLFEICSLYLAWSVMNTKEWSESIDPESLFDQQEMNLLKSIEYGLELGSVIVKQMCYRLIIDYISIYHHKKINLANVLNENVFKMILNYFKNHILVYSNSNQENLDDRTLKSIQMDFIAYSKLIMMGIISAENYVFILTENISIHSPLKDLVNTLIQQIRSYDIIVLRKLVFLSFVESFEKNTILHSELESFENKISQLQTISKQLGHIYSFLVSPTSSESDFRKQIVAFHKMAISYSFSHTSIFHEYSQAKTHNGKKNNFIFLALVSDFSKKLNPTDITSPGGIFEYFKNKLNVSNDPYINIYQESLMSFGSKCLTSMFTRRVATPTSNRKRNVDDNIEIIEDESSSSSEEENTSIDSDDSMSQSKSLRSDIKVQTEKSLRRSAINMSTPASESKRIPRAKLNNSLFDNSFFPSKPLKTALNSRDVTPPLVSSDSEQEIEKSSDLLEINEDDIVIGKFNSSNIVKKRRSNFS